VTPHEQLAARAAAVVRRIPDVARDVIVWAPDESTTHHGTIDRADWQRIVADVIAVLDEMQPSPSVAAVRPEPRPEPPGSDRGNPARSGW
jgi:hypothetical protein